MSISENQIMASQYFHANSSLKFFLANRIGQANTADLVGSRCDTHFMFQNKIKLKYNKEKSNNYILAHI
jgi:hypothetical protein